MPAEPTDPASGPGAEPTLLQRLKERKLVQWALAYLAGAFVVFQGVEVMAQPWGISPSLQRSIHVLLLIGLFITLVLAWYHGEKGRQRVSGPELLMVAALLVIAGGVLSLLGPREETASVSSGRDGDDRPGIAVLPCSNMSPDPDDAYLASGLHEEILVRLQKISSLFSIGRTSVQRYAEDPPPTHEIASTLGVGFVGECSVRKAVDRIRLTFQLLDGQTGGQLWAENYDTDLIPENLFDIESDIAQRVAQAVGAVVTRDEEERIEGKPTQNLEAYQAYMLGRYHLDRRDDPSEAFSEAIRYFQTAIERDPDLAVAHAALAGAYGAMATWGLRDPREILPQVERWARSALTIDSTVAEAHSMLALVSIRDWDWEEAEREIRRALELSPNDPDGHAGYGELLLAQGRIEEAREQTIIATALEPLSSPTLQSRARSAFFSRRSEEASELVDVLLERDPENESAAWALALSALFGGHSEHLTRLFPEVAIDTVRRSPQRRATWAVLLSLLGETDRAKEEIEEAVSSLGDQYVDPRTFWQTYATLGEKDEAFYWMGRSVEVRSYHTMFLGVTPFVDPLRDDPRYQALLDRIGLGHLKASFDSLAASAGDPGPD